MRRFKWGALAGAAICLALLAWAAVDRTHSYNTVEQSYDTVEQLLGAEVSSQQAEIQALSLTSPACYAVYDPVEGSLWFLQAKEKGERVCLGMRTAKIGYPEGKDVPAEISGTVTFSQGEMTYTLCRNDALRELSQVSGDQVIYFSDATLFYS